MYTISTTTATATIYGTVENHSACIKGQVFDNFSDACDAAEAYANANHAAYVKPAAQAPKLKQGQTYVEVVVA